ncbi:MAG: pafB [Ilumatobacteraceae bacterium]|nr:pafB [Ilumatobacteraceae bacterium]
MADALERVTNLLALLLETRRPLTLDEIAAELRNYSATPSAMRGTFERDKAVLRDLGIPIESEVLGGNQAGRSAYWIDRDRYELSGLALSTDERQALQLAVAAVRSGDARFGLLKLGGAVGDDAPVVTNVPTLDVLPALREAAAGRSTVRFEYRGTPRALDPYTLLLREGFWYVMGHDAGHDEVRTYRVDRIEGEVRVGPAGSFTRPPDFDPLAVFPSDPKELGDAAARAVVLVDASRARFVVDELGADAVIDRRADGTVVLEVACANLDAFRSWLFGLGTHAEVQGPPAVREAVVSWLVAMSQGAPR